MKTTLSTKQAAHLLLQDENADWSYNGAVALCEYLEQLEEYEDEIGFYRVVIRCEFSEYRSLYSWADEHFAGDAWVEAVGISIDEEDDDVQNDAILAYLNDHTTVICFEGGVIVQAF